MKKMRLVQLIHGFTTGGAENLVKQYCQLFDRNKIELLVVALHNHHSVFDLELERSGIQVVYIDDIIDRRFSAFPVTVQKAVHRVCRRGLVRKVIQEFDPDVIHYHLLLSGYVKYASPKRGTKIFLTVHSAPRMLWTAKRDRKKDRKDTEWLSHNSSFCFIALHEKMRREINEMFGVGDTIIVNNGVMTERFKIDTPKEKIKKDIGIPRAATVIGHIGRFIPAKNHAFLINLFVRYLKMNPDAILILIGVGVLEDEIKGLVKEKGIEKKVYFLGARGDIPELLHIMDVMVFPSVYEGLPVTLIEAQVAGIPCLVSDRIAEEVRISNLLTFKGLERTEDEWAYDIDQMVKNSVVPVIDTENWDLEKIVKKLESLYAGYDLRGCVSDDTCASIWDVR